MVCRSRKLLIRGRLRADLLRAAASSAISFGSGIRGCAFQNSARGRGLRRGGRSPPGSSASSPPGETMWASRAQASSGCWLPVATEKPGALLMNTVRLVFGAAGGGPCRGGTPHLSRLRTGAPPSRTTWPACPSPRSPCGLVGRGGGLLHPVHEVVRLQRRGLVEEGAGVLGVEDLAAVAPEEGERHRVVGHREGDAAEDVVAQPAEALGQVEVGVPGPGPRPPVLERRLAPQRGRSGPG